MRQILRKLPTIGSPFGANTTPSYAPASVASADVHSVLPVAASRQYITAAALAPFPEREAYTRPPLTPATQAVQSPELAGMSLAHNSTPVSRSWHTTGEPVVSGGNEV